MHLPQHNSDPLIPPHKQLPIVPQIQIKFLIMTQRVIYGLPLPFFLAFSPITLLACTVYWLCHPIVPCCLSLACCTRALSFCRKGPENLGSRLFASLVFSHSSSLHSELTLSRKPSLPASSLDWGPLPPIPSVSFAHLSLRSLTALCCAGLLCLIH